MTIAQAERFYEQDKMKYDVSKNKELLNWLKKEIKDGYNSILDTKNLQELVDYIVIWYEMKYPERNSENSQSLQNAMNVEELLHHLPHKLAVFMECDYRANIGKIKNIYNEKGEVVDSKKVLVMPIKRKNGDELPDFWLYADSDNGQVEVDYITEEYTSEQEITLDELLNVFKEKYSDELDFTNLEECIYNHNCDVELRRRVLELVALKLLYSDRTVPERGYERAKIFINDFNDSFGLNLSSEEIDEVINKDYNNEKSVGKVRDLVKSRVKK